MRGFLTSERRNIRVFTPFCMAGPRSSSGDGSRSLTCSVKCQHARPATLEVVVEHRLKGRIGLAAALRGHLCKVFG